MSMSGDAYIDMMNAEYGANPQAFEREAAEEAAAWAAYELDESERLELDLFEAAIESDELWSFERQ